MQELRGPRTAWPTLLRYVADRRLWKRWRKGPREVPGRRIRRSKEEETSASDSEAKETKRDTQTKKEHSGPMQKAEPPAAEKEIPAPIN